MSYTKLNSQIYYGIHPSIVMPDVKIKHFVDLTLEDEIDTFDYGDATFKRFPIEDRKIPSKKNLIKIINYLLELIYISCKGGHGRSGCIAACFYGIKHFMNGKDVLVYVNKKWSKYRDMELIRPKIRKLGSPQTKTQKTLVIEFLDEYKL